MNWSKPYKLSLPDEATLDAVFYPGDVEKEVPAGYSDDAVCIVKLGTLYNDDAVMDGEEVITPATPMAGWHADLKLRGVELPPELVPFVVHPATPRHVFAGEA